MVIHRMAEGGSAIEITDYPLIDTQRGFCRPFVDQSDRNRREEANARAGFE